MRKFLKRAALPLAAAAALLVPFSGSASATGSWNCNGAWHAMTKCVTTSTSGHFSVQSFSYRGNPYYVYVTVTYGEALYTYRFGPINDTAVHGLNTANGTATYTFYNASGTNYGTQLYHLAVS